MKISDESILWGLVIIIIIVIIALFGGLIAFGQYEIATGWTVGVIVGMLIGLGSR